MTAPQWRHSGFGLTTEGTGALSRNAAQGRKTSAGSALRGTSESSAINSASEWR
ncbi:MAG: hypothetical protein QOI10_3075 [Solirubrobacterales bacterium]|jgi:hypothetical protein|nr:hypothetical protein [Solirubrobacterales bacterium]